MVDIKKANITYEDVIEKALVEHDMIDEYDVFPR